MSAQASQSHIDDETCYCSDAENAHAEPEGSKSNAQATASEIENIGTAQEMFFYRRDIRNRGIYAADDKSSKQIYFVDIPYSPWGTSFTIRRDDQHGDIVATVRRVGPGHPFDILFTGQNQFQYLNDDGKMVFKYGCVVSRTHKFTYRNRKLAWKRGLNVHRLRDLDTDEVIAEFDVTFFSTDKDGKLIIGGEYARDPLWVDVIVTTAMTYQRRARELRNRETF